MRVSTELLTLIASILPLLAALIFCVVMSITHKGNIHCQQPWFLLDKAAIQSQAFKTQAVPAKVPCPNIRRLYEPP
jgi:hypothetical protein